MIRYRNVSTSRLGFAYLVYLAIALRSIPKNWSWQIQDKNDDQDGSRILHVAYHGKDKPIFANAVSFAVAVSDIAAASIWCEQHVMACMSCYCHSEKLPEMLYSCSKTYTSLPWLSYVFTQPRLKTCICNIVYVCAIVTLYRQVCLIWECNLPNFRYNSICCTVFGLKIRTNFPKNYCQ